jgi:2-desacetyl-2-hydroxyethyl bacteriochlorophyllide A dehydrogenase
MVEMPTRIVFTGKQQVQLEAFEPRSLDAGRVRVRALYTLMSTGTENIVFNRLFDPGTHWDKWVQYPFEPGYCFVGVVEATGKSVTEFQPGQVVFGRLGHASHHVVPTERLFPVPYGIEPQQATWAGLAKIAAMGARAAAFSLGDSVLIIGAGPVGQMAVRWANAAGVERLIVVDPVQARLELAHRGGATALIAQPIGEAEQAVRAANGDDLPPCVVDSTGHAAVFSWALKLAARKGRVVLLGDTGMPDEQHLTADVITRGLTIIGAHDTHDDASWNAARIYRLFFQLLRTNRFELSGLNTHFFAPQACAQAYSVANTRRAETMGILFDWTDQHQP